jgi:hypothetical protein
MIYSVPLKVDLIDNLLEILPSGHHVLLYDAHVPEGSFVSPRFHRGEVAGDVNIILIQLTCGFSSVALECPSRD